MAEEADRKAFFDRLTSFNEERGFSNNTSPTISKQSLDLFLLYTTIKSRGGFVDVSKARQWKECANLCNLTLNSSAAYTLKKQYIKHLLPFECHFDRNGVDPQVLISQTEPASKANKKHGKGSAPSPGPGDSNSQGSISSNSTTCSTSYPTSGTPNPSSDPSSSGNSQQIPQGYPPPQPQIPPPNVYPAGYPVQQHPPQQHPPPPQGYNIPGQQPQHQAGPHHSAYNGSAYGYSHQQHHDPRGQQQQYPPPGSQAGYAYPPPPTGHPSHHWQHQTPSPLPPTSSGGPGSHHHPGQQQQQQHMSTEGVANQSPDQMPTSTAYGHQSTGRVPPPRPALPVTQPSSGQQLAGHPPHASYPPPSGGKPGSYYGYHHQGHHDPRGQQQQQQQPANYPPGGQAGYGYPPQTHSWKDSWQGQHHPPPSVPHQAAPAPPPTSSVGPGGHHHPGQQQPPGPGEGVTCQSPFSDDMSSTASYGHQSAGRGPPARPAAPVTQSTPGAGHPAPGQQMLHPQAPYNNGQAYGQHGPHPGQYTPSSHPNQHQPPPPPPGHPSSHPQAHSWKDSWQGQHHPQGVPPPSSVPHHQTPTAPLPPSSVGHRQPLPPGDQVSCRSPFSDEMQQQQTTASYGHQQPGRGAPPPRPAAPVTQQPPPPPSVQSHPPGQQQQQQMVHPQGHPGFPSSAGKPGSFGHYTQHHQGQHHVSDPRSAGQQQTGSYPPPGSQSGYAYPPPQTGHHPRPSMPPPSDPRFGPRPDGSFNRMTGPPPALYPPGHPASNQYRHPTAPSVPLGPGMMMNQPGMMMMRKEITFPPGSVEASQPLLVKRRKVTARDISQIEAWRILMCLKSGLLAESSWALDVLSVLAFDDNTFACFVLSGMPGLLDTLLEHYKKCLTQLFDGLLEEKESDSSDDRILCLDQAKKCPEDHVEGEAESSPEESCSSICRYRIRRNRQKFSDRKWYEIGEDLKENCKPLLQLDPVKPCDHHPCLDNLPSSSSHPRDSSSSQEHSNFARKSSSLVNQEKSMNDFEAKPISNNKSNIPSSSATKTFPLQETQESVNEAGLTLLNGPFNFTHRTRDGKPVKIIDCKDDLTEIEKKWKRLRSPFDDDLEECKASNKSIKDKSCLSQDWDESQHILTQFAPRQKFVRFVKLLTSSSKTSKDVKEEETENKKLSKETSCSDVASSKEKTMEVTTNHVINDKKNAAKDTKEVSEEEEKITDQVYPRFRSTRKRKYDLFDELEEEAYQKDQSFLYPVDEYCEGLTRRTIVLSTLLRNLSFVPGNENEIARHQGLMKVFSRLLLLNHEHPPKSKNKLKTQSAVSKEQCQESPAEESDAGLFNEDVKDEEEDKDSKEDDEQDDMDLEGNEWFWDTMHFLLENTLVTLANVSGQIDLSPFPEEVSLPLLDGLLHWSVCPSSYAQDHFPMTSMTNLSPSRLAVETLVKLSIREGNVDLILSTPPWERLDRLFNILTKKLARNEDQTLREFSLVLLVNLSSADTSIARAVALTGNAIPQLISFVEQSEQSAMSVAQNHGVNALRENPEMMGTTLDMVRRAALCLRCLARIPDNRPLFMVHQQRLLNLVMSQILDQGVAGIMADVIYECCLNDPTLQATRDVFLPYILPSDASSSHVVSHRPLTPPAPSSSTASVVNGDHSMSRHHDSSQEPPSHAPLINTSQANGTVTPSSLLINNGNVSKTETEQMKREDNVTASHVVKTSSPILMNGCLEPPTSNHLDSLLLQDNRSKIELSKVPPAVKMEHHSTLKGLETTPVVAVNHHDASSVLPVKNNGTNSSGDQSKGCPRLKELLLSYQMSPKFDSPGMDSQGQQQAQQQQPPATEQITS